MPRQCFVTLCAPLVILTLACTPRQFNQQSQQHDVVAGGAIAGGAIAGGAAQQGSASLEPVLRPGRFVVIEKEYALPPTFDDGVLARPDGFGMPLATQLAGRIYLPEVLQSSGTAGAASTANTTGQGPRPLVVILHGAHQTCGFYPDNSDPKSDPRIDTNHNFSITGTCPDGFEVVPSYRGYDYIARHLASHGIAVVSVDANRGVAGGGHPNPDDPYLIAARGRLVLRNLELLKDWNDGASSNGLPAGLQLMGSLDFSQVGLMGHSRGGEGMRAAYAIYRENTGDFFKWKKEKPDIQFRAIFEIGAVDFGFKKTDQSKSYFDAPGVAWSALVAGCDGDVKSFRSVNPYTRMMQDAGTHPRSVVVAWGANHNFFNTEWHMTDSLSCRGTLVPLWNTQVLGRKIESKLIEPVELATLAKWYEKKNLPGVRGSDSQQAIGRLLVTAFFKAHLGSVAEKTPTLARVFDPSFALPKEISTVTDFARQYISPGVGVMWGSGDVQKKIIETHAVTVKPLAELLEAEARVFKRKLALRAGENVVFSMPELESLDAVTVAWGQGFGATPSVTPPRLSLVLPPLAPGKDVGLVQVVLANFDQTRPCMQNPPDGSCRGVVNPLDFSLQFVNPDGQASVKRRASEFLSLRPHLKSNITAVTFVSSIPVKGSSAKITINRHEPIFDTLVLNTKDFKLFDGKDFAFSNATRLRLIMEHSPSGTLALRTVRLLSTEEALAL